jgi:hypothetical protein
MKQKHVPTLDELPDSLTAVDIAAHLRVSTRRVYEHFKLSPDHGGIPNFRFGKTILVDKPDFVKWKESRKREQAKRFAR